MAVFLLYRSLDLPTSQQIAGCCLSCMSSVFAQVNVAEIPCAGALRTWHKPWLVPSSPRQFETWLSRETQRMGLLHVLGPGRGSFAAAVF